MQKPTILTFVDYYLPGYKFGGPVRAVANMVQRLGDQFAFRILTRDRDRGERAAYPGCAAGVWQAVGKAQVLYLPPQQVNLRHVRRIINETPHDVVYLNSFFSPQFTILPLLLRRLGLVPERPTVLAPRGEFSTSALRMKRTKKQAYIRVARRLGFYDGVLWQASTEHEERDIRRGFAGDLCIRVASDMPPPADEPDAALPAVAKTPGALDVAFLGRVNRMKNLDGALEMLRHVRGRVRLHLYGPKEDAVYWSECCRLIRQLPDNIRVEDHGSVPHDEVAAAIRRHQLLLLPTLGENFGFVILEALLAGCPVLLSDRTPWRDLAARGAGWDLPLESPERFHAVLQQCIDMGHDQYQRLSAAARAYGRAAADDPDILNANRRLFQLALETPRRAA